MTVLQKLEKMLIEHGLRKHQAERVMQNIGEDPGNTAIKDRWNDPLDIYDPDSFSPVWSIICHAALAYIDANCPNERCRANFTDPTF